MYSSKRTPVTNDGTYNGYKNWETWTVNLWLTSEELTYLMLEYLAETSNDVQEMADKAKEYVMNNNPLAGQPSLYHDLLTSALEEVDWVQAVKFVWDVYHERRKPDEPPVPEDNPLQEKTNKPHDKHSDKKSGCF